MEEQLDLAELEVESVAEEDSLEAESFEDEDVEVDQLSTDSSTESHLKLLLDFILMTHNKTKRHTGLTKPFDLIEIVPNLPYYDTENGEQKINSRKFKSFLDEYMRYCEDNSQEDITFKEEKAFLHFLLNRYKSNGLNEAALRTKIQHNWPKIQERLDIIDKINGILQNTNIGLIEVRDINATDAQKIFNIINSEGEKLTAVEILSAKPLWNIRVNNASAEAKESVEDLYKYINTASNDIVKWDMAATFISRIGDNNIFKTFERKTQKEFERELTIGFKILAGIFSNGIKKENIEELSANNNIRWEKTIDELINELKQMIKVISTHSYFRFFKSWRTSIMELLSDTIALNFMILAYKDWQRKGKPVGTDQQAIRFQKNCFIMLDQLIYDYMTGKWRGSADSTIASNISKLNAKPELFESQSTEKWANLLEEIFTSYTVDGNKISQGLMTPLLYHCYCLNKISGPGTAYGIEVDHIIPQKAFTTSTLENKEIIKDSILNLGLLPKDENGSKNDKDLASISGNAWLVAEIVNYEQIPEDKFVRFSNLVNYMEMFELRKPFFKDAMGTQRTFLLMN